MAFARIVVIVPAVLSVFLGWSLRAAAATLHPARIANAHGDPGRFCNYYGEDHLADLASEGAPAPQSFAPASGAWQRPFDLAGTSTIEREMASQLLVADNKERAARAVGSAGNPGNPAPRPLRASASLSVAAAHWANCLASAGATAERDDPDFAADDVRAGFRGEMEAEVAFELFSKGSPPDTGAVNVGYMQSTAHRDVILGSGFTEIGISVACGPGGSCAEVEELGGPIKFGPRLESWPEDPIVVAPHGLSANKVLPGAPRIVAAGSHRTNSCTVRWAAPAKGGYDPISGYSIVFAPPALASQAVTLTRNARSRRATATGLAPGPYTVTVAAVNDLGVGPTAPLALAGRCLVRAPA
jgi:uncharacterized protein YkwD